MATNRHWSDAQIKDFVRIVRRRAGDAWLWLVPDLRRALIAEKALSIIGGQDCKTVEVAAVNELISRMIEVSGVEP